MLIVNLFCVDDYIRVECAKYVIDRLQERDIVVQQFNRDCVAQNESIMLAQYRDSLAVCHMSDDSRSYGADVLTGTHMNFFVHPTYLIDGNTNLAAVTRLYNLSDALQDNLQENGTPYLEYTGNAYGYLAITNLILNCL